LNGRAIIATALLATALLKAGLASAAPTPAVASFADGQEAADRGDYAAAVAAWTPLAEAGDPTAQAGLAALYALGRGVPVDLPQALALYRRAAVQDHAAAQFNLGQLLRSRQAGAYRDPAEALAWYDRAADQGHAEAHYKIGLMRARGEAGPPDLVAAHMRWTLAENLGFAEARKQRASLTRLMTPTQIAEAGLRARQWQAAFDTGRDELARLRRRLDAREGEIADLRAAIAARTGEAAALRREIDALDAEIVRLHRDATARTALVATLPPAAAAAPDKPPGRADMTAADRNDDDIKPTVDAGITAYNDRDYPRAFAIWRALAHDGNARAQFHLGALYHEGRGVARDPVEARHWLGVAAHNGSSQARALLETLE
jgi:TPR repeat protein